jgi:diadenosine tetraphosphate (Ap4A) HIT family hydrolase
VFHVHFHIIPRPGPHEGLGLEWAPRSLDKSEAAELVKSITTALQKTP